MKYFSMFSGVEGFGLGLPTEHFSPIGFSEIDKYASMVLKYHYPKIKNYGDCKTIKWEEVANFDLLTGGSPCQDFSIAGKRRGLGGSRSSLAWEFIRCLRSKKPRYFIWENVKGVMSSRGGWDFANIITAFSESGYSLWWQVLNAKDFGVPQNRERIFVIGFREGSPKEVFFERQDTGTTDGESGNKLREQVANTLRTNYSNGRSNETYIQVQNKGASQHYRIYGEDGLAPTLQSQSGMSSQKHPFIINKSQYDTEDSRPEIGQARRRYGTKGIIPPLNNWSPLIVASRGRNLENPTSRKSGLPTEQMLEPNLQGTSNTLTGVEKDNYVAVRKSGDRGKQKVYTSDTMGALSSNPMSDAIPQISDGMQIRKLMPIECERLMSWKDDVFHATIELCLDQVKNYVDAVQQNPKLRKLVLSVERNENKELAKIVEEVLSTNNLRIKSSVQGSVISNSKKGKKKETQSKKLNVSVEKPNEVVHQKSESSALSNVSIDLIEGKIITIGKEELQAKEESLTHQQSGRNVLKLFGENIMQLAKGVEKDFPIELTNNFIYITSSHLDIRVIDIGLIILYFFATSATDGFTQSETKRKNISLSLNLHNGWTKFGRTEKGEIVEISDSQRYRMCGNGVVSNVVRELVKILL